MRTTGARHRPHFSHPTDPTSRSAAQSLAGRLGGPCRTLGAAAPGLVATAVGVVLAALLHRTLPGIALLTAAVLVGIVVGNTATLWKGIPESWAAGTQIAATRLLRIGVVLLGLRLVMSELLALGAGSVLVIIAIVAATLVGTYWLAAVFGMSRTGGLLLAGGYAICGASAVTAISSTIEADEEEVATAIAMVTLCGSLAILVLPLLSVPLNLTAPEFGAWVGASVHDVGQVVAAASTSGPVALEQAAVIKLTRVALLAPLVAVLALAARRRSAPGPRSTRPPLVPLFVVGFLLAAAIRSTDWLPMSTVVAVDVVRELLLAAALFALGLSVRLDRLVKTGGKALAVGLCAWALIAGVSLIAVLLGWLS